MKTRSATLAAVSGAVAFGMAALIGGTTAQAQIVHNGDVIIDGSLCVGFDCVNGEAFGFDTIRLKENNLRIHFDDTSNSASFPNNDWRLVANDTANGGRNIFIIEDASAGREVFSITAGAPSNSLTVDSAGDVGIGTANAVVELHVKDGNSPTLRLEQDGSNGFAPQTWDVAGNEANFFIRDVTNGSLLSFKIKPGAPENSVFIAEDGDIGLGTANPGAGLHVRRTNGTAKLFVEEASASNAARGLAEFRNNGIVFIRLEDTSQVVGSVWNVQNNAGNAVISSPDGPNVEFTLDTNGNLVIGGEITTSGSCSGGCDRVFDTDYDLPTIGEHASLMWANKHLPAVGPTAESGPMNLSKKMGGMLNELEKAHIYIEQLHKRLEGTEKLELAIAKLRAEIDSLRATNR